MSTRKGVTVICRQRRRGAVTALRPLVGAGLDRAAGLALFPDRLADAGIVDESTRRTMIASVQARRTGGACRGVVIVVVVVVVVVRVGVVGVGATAA